MTDNHTEKDKPVEELHANIVPIRPPAPGGHLRSIPGGRTNFELIPGGKPVSPTFNIPLTDVFNLGLPLEMPTAQPGTVLTPPPSTTPKKPLPEVTVTPATPLSPIRQKPYKHPVDEVIRETEKERQRRNKKKPKPGSSPQTKPGGNKKKVEPKEEPFDNNRFHQKDPKKENQWTEGTPSDQFGNPPDKEKKPTKKRTPADRVRERRRKHQTEESQPMIQDGPGQPPRPMTANERNMAVNGPSANTPPTPATPPATTPTPAQNPAAPARTPGTRRQETKKEAVEREFEGRPINGLTEADRRKIREGGYTLSTNPKSGPPTIRRTSHTSGKSGLHMEDVGGVWTIQKGPAPANNRLPSSPATMKKNILEGTGVKEIPPGHQIHHNIPVETWKRKELTKLAQKYGVAGGVDAKDGMILAPSTSEAKNRTGGDVDKLEQQGKLLRILHPGSHPGFTEYVDRLVDQERDRLKLQYGVNDLEKISPDKLSGELDNSIKNIRKEIADELKNADQKIKAGKYNDLPKEIKDFIKPDPNRQNQYKISDQSTDQEVARFKNALGDVVAKARNLNTHNLSNASSKAVLSATSLGTQQSYAEMLALSVAASKGGDPATKNSMFTTQDKGPTIDIYANGNESKLASINRKNGKAETITIERGMTSSEKQNLSEQRSEMQAINQSQAQAQKTASKGNSLQRGM